MLPKSNRVLNILSHTSAPITVKSIAMRALIDEHNDTCPKTRKIIRQLIDDGHCIGSTKDGYTLMSTGKEIQEYLNSLLKRQIGISRRIQAVYDSAIKQGLL